MNTIYHINILKSRDETIAMAVLSFQIGIFCILAFAGLFGSKIVWMVTIWLSIFTLIEVFMPPLMFLQFVTIFFGFLIGQKIAAEVHGTGK